MRAKCENHHDPRGLVDLKDAAPHGRPIEPHGRGATSFKLAVLLFVLFGIPFEVDEKLAERWLKAAGFARSSCSSAANSLWKLSRYGGFPPSLGIRLRGFRGGGAVDFVERGEEVAPINEGIGAVFTAARDVGVRASAADRRDEFRRGGLKCSGKPLKNVEGNVCAALLDVGDERPGDLRALGKDPLNPRLKSERP